MINEDTRRKTIDAGFDGCLVSPITYESIQDLMTNYVNKYVDEFMSEELLNVGQNSVLLAIIESITKNQQSKKFDKRQSTIPEELKEYSDSLKVSSSGLNSGFTSKVNINKSS